MPVNPINILLAEDSPADAELIQEGFLEAKVFVTLHHVLNGVEALAFLHREGRFSDAVRPDLVLLDLNMPKMDGREVLDRVKSDDDLKTIPIVVLTSSEAEEDIVRSYAAHANCYVSKPVGLEGLVKIVSALEGFWLSVVKLPK